MSAALDHYARLVGRSIANCFASKANLAPAPTNPAADANEYFENALKRSGPLVQRRREHALRGFRERLAELGEAAP